MNIRFYFRFGGEIWLGCENHRQSTIVL